MKDVNYKEIEYFGRLNRECFSDNTTLNVFARDYRPSIWIGFNLKQLYLGALDLKGLDIRWEMQEVTTSNNI